uniref:Uncharacterized protein n=1 Tax=Knipowitschia caucasica TaxID=637954 RepID=A0AAV2JIG2_KNICA
MEEVSPVAASPTGGGLTCGCTSHKRRSHLWLHLPQEEVSPVAAPPTGGGLTYGRTSHKRKCHLWQHLPQEEVSPVAAPPTEAGLTCGSTSHRKRRSHLWLHLPQEEISPVAASFTGGGLTCVRLYLPQRGGAVGEVRGDLVQQEVQDRVGGPDTGHSQTLGADALTAELQVEADHPREVQVLTTQCGPVSSMLTV